MRYQRSPNTVRPAHVALYVPPLTVVVTVTLTPLASVVLRVALVLGDVRRLTPEQAVTLAKVVAADVAAAPAAQGEEAGQDEGERHPDRGPLATEARRRMLARGRAEARRTDQWTLRLGP